MTREDASVTIHAIRADAVRRLDWTPLCERLPERMERAGRFRRENDRLLCAGAGFLLLKAFELRDESELRRGENGKPFLPGRPAFNLSHSGEWCVLAVGEGDVGADIERLDERNLGVAPEACTPGELAWMRQSPLERFYQLWTWKESVMKATGLGMALEPSGFEVLPFAQGRPLPLRGALWHAWSKALDGYSLSVCASRPIGRVRWIEHGAPDK